METLLLLPKTFVGRRKGYWEEEEEEEEEEVEEEEEFSAEEGEVRRSDRCSVAELRDLFWAF